MPNLIYKLLQWCFKNKIKWSVSWAAWRMQRRPLLAFQPLLWALRHTRATFTPKKDGGLESACVSTSFLSETATRPQQQSHAGSQIQLVGEPRMTEGRQEGLRWSDSWPSGANRPWVLLLPSVDVKLTSPGALWMQKWLKKNTCLSLLFTHTDSYQWNCGCAKCTVTKQWTKQRLLCSHPGK